MQKEDKTASKGVASGIPVYCAFDELADIGSLKPHPRNPNRHPESQIVLLAKIIKAQGWRAPITVSNRSGYIVRGHGRLLAAQLLGVKQVPVDRQDYASDEEELADLIADNRIAELAEMDNTMLKDVLEELDTGAFDMDLTGFAEDALEDLMTQFHVQDEDDVEDDFDVAKALAEIAKPRISEGEVWTLGRHRLMCGDSTKRDTWERLFGGQKADLIVTSPPYNVGIKYASYKDKQAKDEYLGMIAAVGELMFQHLRSGRYVAWNVGVSPDSYPHYHVVVLEGCGFEFYRQIVWEKAGVPYPIFPSTLRARRARHYKPNYKHEVIYLLEAPADEVSLPLVECPVCDGTGHVMGHVAPVTHEMLVLFEKGKAELGGRIKPSRKYANDIWHIVQSAATTDLPTLGTKSSGLEKKGKKSHMLKAHPAAFPVELPRAVMLFLSNEGEIVCDPFMGAGATLIAAEKMGRIAYGIELDPIYCELTMQRWETLTGQKAVKLE